MTRFHAILLTYTISCCLWACNAEKQAKETNSNHWQKETQFHNLFETLEAFDTIKFTYLDAAVKVLPNGNYLTGAEAIKTNLEAHPISIKSKETIKLIEANKDRAIFYELGNLIMENGKQQAYLLIWSKESNVANVEFEFIAEKVSVEPLNESLNQRRTKWMEWCNAHQVENLVNDLYSEQTLYFNHKPLVVGREDLIPEYSYMKREDYQLTLTPIVLEFVNGSLAIEIGQCSGSYGGKYILIWQRIGEGDWQIMVDSNI